MGKIELMSQGMTESDQKLHVTELKSHSHIVKVTEVRMTVTKVCVGGLSSGSSYAAFHLQMVISNSQINKKFSR